MHVNIPSPQHIDLQNTQSVNVVLVPFDHRAVFHRRVFNRAQLVEPPLSDNKAADMLGKVARKADDFSDQADGLGEAAVGRIKPQFADTIRISPSFDIPQI